MLNIKNTFIAKWINRIFEQNSMFPVDWKYSNIITPTVAVEPDIIYRNRTTDGTIFTVPTDRKFYLTNCYISAGNSSAASITYDSITFNLMDGSSGQFMSVCSVVSEATNNGSQISFPKAGILLQPGSTIEAVRESDGAFFSIAGYYGSDKA